MKSPQEIRELILDLLKHKNASTHKMLTECGYNTNLVNDLKKGQMPSADKIANIANYLGVSTDYLLGNEPAEPGIASEDDNDLLKDLRIAFYGVQARQLTQQDKESILDMAKLIARVKSESGIKKTEQIKNEGD